MLAFTLLVAAFSGLLAGCGDEPGVVEPATADQMANASTQPASIMAVARAFRDVMSMPQGRQALLSALASSSAPEQKLYLGDVLADSGSALAGLLKGQISQHGGVQAVLNGLPPLEVYFPVDAHRVAWAGGVDLLIGVQLRESEPPIALSVEHGGVVMLSLQSPPATPTLMIVPEERRAPRIRPGGSGTLANRGTTEFPNATVDGEWYPDGIYMRSLSLAEDGEAWPRGDPEIEVHLVAPHSADAFSTLDTWSCAHEGSSNPYRRFNMDGRSWSGDKVLLADSIDIDHVHDVFVNAGKPDSAAFVFDVWEDDTDTCAIVSTANSWHNRVVAATIAAGLAWGWLLVLGDCHTGELDNPWACAAALSIGWAVPFV